MTRRDTMISFAIGGGSMLELHSHFLIHQTTVSKPANAAAALVLHRHHFIAFLENL